jgi:1-acyl-sn-glycerol-3-phosphate acyltransferase
MPTRVPMAKKPKRKRWIDQQSPFWYYACVVGVGLVLRYWVRYFRAFGAENVPMTGGVFIICNHTTALDPFMLGLPIWRLKLRIPAKAQFFSVPVMGFLMAKFGSFPLRQGGADAVAVRTMIELYRGGRAIMIYPEGKRSHDGEMLPFLPEFARLMIKLRARIVPAAVAGGSEVQPIGRKIPRRNIPVTVVYGHPCCLSDFYDRPLTPAVLVEAADVLHRQVADQLAIARVERAKLIAARSRPT